ncbi:Voltage-dependent T-type calcium channel subunit alpha-1I, partial [Frankliniella fusca]
PQPVADCLAYVCRAARSASEPSRIGLSQAWGSGARALGPSAPLRGAQGRNEDRGIFSYLTKKEVKIK